MKKLNLLVLPLMAISFLTNCGGGGSTPTEDVEFTTQSEVELDRDNKKAIISLNWKPSDHSIECSDFIFTLNNQSDITSNITLGELGSRPLKVTIDFAKALEANDKGDLKFKYNDKTAKKEGEGKVTGINIKLHENPPAPTYTLNATCANGTVKGNQGQYEENADVALTFIANQEYFLPASLDEFDEVTGIDKSTITYNSTTGSLTFKMPAKPVVTIKATATKPETKGTIKWTNYDDTLLVDAYELDIGSFPVYSGPTPTQPKDTTHVHRFTGWTPDPTKTPVVKGDNIFKAVYDDVPITDVGAEFKITIPSSNADKTFAFACDGEEKLTVDWGDTTVDNNNSHTYSKSGTYVVSIYREDITSVNVTDETSKSYITEINFKDKITSIADEAFSSCANLTSINIAKNVTSIGVDTFSDCNALSKIVVASDNSIYDSRNSCNAIVETATNTLIKGCNKSSIPDTITAIGDYAFRNCSKFSSGLVIPGSVKTIGSYAFYGCTSIVVISFDYNNSSLTSIGDYAFSYCSNLSNLLIPDSLLTIGESAFSFCDKLISVQCTTDASLTSIGNIAFSRCTSLSTAEIPDTIVSVGTNAFSNCNLTYTTYNECEYLASKSGNKYLLLVEAPVSITSTTIHDSCKVVCGSAFYDCDKLMNITINSSSSLVTIGDSAFESCISLTSITIPKSVTSISYKVFGNCSSLTTIKVNTSNATYTSQDKSGKECNAIITIDGKTLVAGCKATAIPNSVTSIGNYAFYFCDALTSIDIPNSVTSIGAGAFEACTSLASITIPSGVTSIGDDAFYYCTDLTSITIPSGVIGDYAFGVCYSLASVTILDDVTSIGARAFEACISLASITIPSSVTSIGTRAFESCTSLAIIKVDTANNVYTSQNGSGNECNAIITKKMTSDNIPANTLIVGCKNTTIPNNVTSIGESAFKECSALTSITIPNSVTSIGSYAFAYCSGLTSIVIPNGVTSIDNQAFLNCSILETVDLTAFVEEDPDNIPSLGADAFDYCDALTTIKVANDNMAKIFKEKDGWSDYADKIVVA